MIDWAPEMSLVFEAAFVFVGVVVVVVAAVDLCLSSLFFLLLARIRALDREEG